MSRSYILLASALLLISSANARGGKKGTPLTPPPIPSRSPNAIVVSAPSLAASLPRPQPAVVAAPRPAIPAVPIVPPANQMPNPSPKMNRTLAPVASANLPIVSAPSVNRGIRTLAPVVVPAPVRPVLPPVSRQNAFNPINKNGGKKGGNKVGFKGGNKGGKKGGAHGVKESGRAIKGGKKGGNKGGKKGAAKYSTLTNAEGVGSSSNMAAGMFGLVLAVAIAL